MRIYISDKDKIRAEDIKFICEKVLIAKDVNADLVTVSDIYEINAMLNEKQAIFIYNEENDVISADNLVDLIIMNGSEAILFAVAETKQKLYRFLPANPYALISTGSYESELIMKLSDAIDNLNDNACDAFA